MKTQEKINLIDSLSRLIIMNSSSAELKARVEEKIFLLLDSIIIK